MKHLLTITLLIFFKLTTFSEVDKQPNNPKELGEMVFKSFQNENYELFLKYIFTETDCDIMVKNADAPDSLKITVVNQMKCLTNHIRQTSKENFEMIISTGKQKGIKWQKVNLKEVKFETKNRNNIESAGVYLSCIYKNIAFIIILNNCHKSDVWLMMDNAEIKFK